VRGSGRKKHCERRRQEWIRSWGNGKKKVKDNGETKKGDPDTSKPCRNERENKKMEKGKSQEHQAEKMMQKRKAPTLNYYSGCRKSLEHLRLLIKGLTTGAGQGLRKGSVEQTKNSRGQGSFQKRAGDSLGAVKKNGRL